MAAKILSQAVKTELERIQQLNWGVRGVSDVLAEDVDRGALALQRKADLHSALAALTKTVDQALENIICPPAASSIDRR